MIARRTKIVAVQSMRIISITLICCFVIALCINSAVSWYIRRQDAAIRSAVLRQTNSAPSSDDLSSSPVPAPAALLVALQEPNDFHVRYRVSAIPHSVRAAFAKVVGQSEFSMAEPGARWSAGCVRLPGLPHRRLESVAIRGSLCLVFYERGGFAKTDDIAVFHITGDGDEPLWHGYRQSSVKDPAGFIAAVKADHTLVVGDKLFF